MQTIKHAYLAAAFALAALEGIAEGTGRGCAPPPGSPGRGLGAATADLAACAVQQCQQ